MSNGGNQREREELRREAKAAVCAPAPGRRLACSDRSRLTTSAAHIVEGKGEWTA